MINPLRPESASESDRTREPVKNPAVRRTAPSTDSTRQSAKDTVSISSHVANQLDKARKLADEDRKKAQVRTKKMRDAKANLEEGALEDAKVIEKSAKQLLQAEDNEPADDELDELRG